MKKTVLLLLVSLTVLSLLLSSCRDNNDNTESGISSEITYYDDESSTIAKTETDGSFTFAFDPYVLPEDVKKALGGNANYKKFARAVVSREEYVTMDSRDDYDNIRFAIGENFPFSFLIEGYKYDSTNNRILISYNYEKTHDSKIEEFEKAVGNIFDECVNNSDNDVIAAVSIYAWLAQNIQIVQNETTHNTHDVQDTSSEIAQQETASKTDDEENKVVFDYYTTLIDKKGSEESVAALYNFLLLQLGVEGKTVGCWQNNQYRTWNMVCLDSKWYHCDILMEQKETEGTGLKYFGLNKERLAQHITAKEIYTGQWKWFTNKIPKANSSRFDDFEKVVSWEVSADRSSIDAFTEEYSRFVFEI